MYIRLDSKYYNDDPLAETNFDLPNMGIYSHNDYCEKVDSEIEVLQK